MNASEAHTVCRRHGLLTEYNTLIEQEIAPKLVGLENVINDLLHSRDVLRDELAAKDERIERLLNEIDEWNDAWSERGATLQAFLAEVTEQRHLLIEINTWLGNNPEWDLHLEPPWYKRLYEAIEDDPAAGDEYAEVRKV